MSAQPAPHKPVTVRTEKIEINMKKVLPLLAPILLFAASPISLHAQVATNAPPPKPKWESSAAAGVTLTRGNSSTLLATLSGKTGRKWDGNELSLGADAAYGESKVNGVTSRNADSIDGFAQYNRLFTERLYGYGRVDALHDEIADIKYRVVLAPGLGYYFIKDKKTELGAEVGPGYVIEELDGNRDSYASLRVGEKFHQEISDRARIWENAEWLPQVDKFKNYIVNAELGIEADLTADKRLALRAVLQDTYNNDPAPARQKNDAKLITAIAYKF